MKETFVLPNFENLLDTATSLAEKVVVVSIIGKSPFNAHGLKLKCIGRYFISNSKRNKDCSIEGYLDETKQVLYLHVYSMLDAEALVTYYKDFAERCDTERKCNDFLAVNDDIKSSFAKCLLLLLNISHIIILSHPGSTFDTNYIQYFKAVLTLSQKLSNKISNCLESVDGISEDWITNGRPCLPRMLFYFEKCPKNVTNIKKVEHNLEDKIYHILKKTRIVNPAGNSLFAIPLNQEFVYISNEPPLDRLGDVVKGLIRDCQSGGVLPINPPFSNELDADRSFHKFLQVHIKQAKHKGFNDTVSQRHMSAPPCPFELPSLKHWVVVVKLLYDLIMTKKLVTSLCTDTRFSEQRCRKVSPLAFAQYQEGLPLHYGKAEHEARLTLALNLFRTQARGPMYHQQAAQLKADCLAHWENGRQQCEVASMTGNPCKLPKHSVDQEHLSGVVYKAVCDCGRKIGNREDPYTAKQANYVFYHQIAKECQCSKLERVSFPVFEPSITEYKAATLHDNPEEALSVLSEHSGELTPDMERGLIRQPSTTEYLPGMLTLNSPPGLLPVFSSWSLVCLGPSSLYSHNLGLSETFHPGFLSSTNYLLPWDVTVYSKGKSNWPQLSKYSNRGRRGRPAGGSPQFTVKVFIGVEYECPSGHRFMLSAPDKVLKATPGSIVKDTGHRIAESDMPLYYPCACRAGKVAQLMRLHVVTPKAPVHCTLNPKVQPASGAPIFICTVDGPTKLTQSSYWVMRLPYVYEADKEHYSQNYTARLLQGVFGVNEVNEEQ